MLLFEFYQIVIVTFEYEFRIEPFVGQTKVDPIEHGQTLVCQISEVVVKVWLNNVFPTDVFTENFLL